MDANLERAFLEHRIGRFWIAVMSAFLLPILLSFEITKSAFDKADMLGGRETVEKFYTANLLRLALTIVVIVVFVLVFIKTWKGRRSSMMQLIAMFGTAGTLIFALVSSVCGTNNIHNELKNPTNETVKSYVLCESNGNYYLGFDNKSGESILLNIPDEKYKELKKGKTDESSDSEVYKLVKNDQYTVYKDTCQYKGELDVTYYQASVIYENCKVK